MTEFQERLIKIMEDASGETKATPKKSQQLYQDDVSKGGAGPEPGKQYQETSVKPEGIKPEYMNDDYWSRHQEAVQQNRLMLESNPDMNYREDLARGSRTRNVSDMTPEETLRYSRLADALNNRYYRGMQQLRSGVALRGGQYSGSTGSLGELYRMPIETEEMRQQARSRDYETFVRAAEVSRQQALKGLPLDQVQSRLAAQLRESTNMSDAQIQQHMAIFNYQLQYDLLRQQQAFARHYGAFMSFLQQVDIPHTQANLIARSTLVDPLLASAFSSITGGGITASPEHAILFNALANKLKDVTDPVEAQRINYETLVKLGAEGLSQISRMAPTEAADIVGAAKEGLKRLGE